MSTHTSNLSNTDGLVMFHPMLRICSLSVAVSRERDLARAKDEMPPEEILSNGRKHLVPKGTTRKLLACRKQVERALLVDGFKFLGGFANPESAAPGVLQKLRDIETEFQSEVDAIAINLRSLYRTQQQAHPQWIDILKEGELSESQFRSRCGFATAIFTLASPGPNAGQAASQEFGKIRSQAVPQLLEHIADEALLLLRDFNPADISGRIVQPLGRLVGKLSRFSFLDGSIAPVAAALQSQLALLPKVAQLDSGGAGIALNLLHALADPARLLTDSKLLQPPVSGALPLFAPPALPAISVQSPAVVIPTTFPSLPAPAPAQPAFALGF